MQFPAVLFDLGQTLLDYGPQAAWPEFRVRRMVELYPLAKELWGDIAVPPDEFGRMVGGGIQTDGMRAIEHDGLSMRFEERLREALAAVGIKHADDGGLQRMVEAFNEPVRAWPRPFPETLAALESLRALGVKMAIITNTPWDTPSEPLYSDLERWGLRGFFTGFVGSGEAPWRKPNPEFMWAAAKQLDTPAERCLVAGDNLMADIAGARAAGMRSVWMNREGAAPPAQAPRPDWVATSLTEVVRIVASS